jgi:hypothetical protein
MILFKNIIKKFYIILAKNYLKKESLTNIVSEAKKNNNISTGVGLTDYYFLAKYIKENKINKVLELGTGVSTFLIAETLKKYSKKPTLISMESKKKYYDKQKKVFPFKKYNFCKILLSKRKKYEYSFLTGFGYQNIPDLDYDLVFIDGPDPNKYKRDEPASFCFDFINLILKNNKPFDVIIDTRMSTSIVTKLLFPHKYKYLSYLNLTLIKQLDKKEMYLTKPNIKKFKKFANNKSIL